MVLKSAAAIALSPSRILHGGTLEIESAPNEGARVTARFPKERAIA